MKDIDYACAVARIRYNEMSMLTGADMEQLISSPDYDSALHRLSDFGYEVASSSNSSELLKKEIEKAWALVSEIAPDKSELNVLAVRNAFHNLKAALKGYVSGGKCDEYYLEPSCVDNEIITQAVTTGDFGLLPEYMCDAARESYAVLTSTGKGQIPDVILDRAALDTFEMMARETGSGMLCEVAQLLIAAADVKIAYRSILTGKDEEFMDRAISGCEAIDKKSLITAASEGVQALVDYISSTRFSDAAELIIQSPAAFEKWCDDSVVRLISGAKYSAFGFEPIAAYFLAKENEIKTVRIILSAKQNSLPPEIIRERVRLLYV
ncbi:MAG: V-type ATPase subunit [Clostridiales bacterium]|nr:V-type ATPase subunit [Clostridiales bacterium]